MSNCILHSCHQGTVREDRDSAARPRSPRRSHQDRTKGKVGTYNAIGKAGTPTDGANSSHLVVDQDFVLGIPEGISLDVVASLLCAERKLGAEIEAISGEQIDEAYDRVVASDVRYRFGIDTDTF